MTRFCLSAIAIVLAASALSCGDELSSSGDGGGSRAVVVGSANFPENVILGEIYAGALTAQGLDVSTELNVGSREVLLPVLERGEIDVLPEYTGALLDHLGKGSSDATETAAQIQAIRGLLPDGLTILAPSRAQDQETITCSKPVVDRHGLRTIGDLAPVSRELTFGGPPELPQRSGFGLKGLKSVYGVEFKRFRALDVAGPLTVAALKSGKVDCANLFSTQSAIEVNGFVVLADPETLIASQAVVPLLSEPAATPEVTTALDRVSAALTTEELKEMVARVEIDKRDAAEVAAGFLARHGLDAGR